MPLRQTTFVNFSFISSNIPAATAYGVYIFQLIRYSRACGSYHDFLDRGLLHTRKLLNQGSLLVKLKSSLRAFYARNHDLVNRYRISVSQLTTDMFRLSQSGPFITNYQVCKKSNTMDATCAAGTAYPPEDPSSPPDFSGIGLGRFRCDLLSKYA